LNVLTMNYTEFEKKVKSMSAHDIIMAMVDGLRNPRTKINMRTFGEIRDGICYGCAATNAVLRIMDAKEEEVEEHFHGRRSDSYKASPLWQFESAINFLRCGMVGLYNECAAEIGIAPITPMPGLYLLRLGNNYTEEQL